MSLRTSWACSQSIASATDRGSTESHRSTINTEAVAAVVVEGDRAGVLGQQPVDGGGARCGVQAGDEDDGSGHGSPSRMRGSRSRWGDRVPVDGMKMVSIIIT
ncbi:hypothetical protein Pta02_77780 [Planobispora takensis]|uniref:Uncharacterized protein n=1 Tax=Planobispora takensis TaxID=1367882 RepID=A0A8J3WXY5_9ACTN|nr:hypothetical protein Pta02_77780 [Planobispora takensis]